MSALLPTGPLHATTLPPARRGGRRQDDIEPRTLEPNAPPARMPAAIDVRLALSRSGVQGLVLMLDGRSLGSPITHVDESGVDVHRWHLPEGVPFVEEQVRLVDAHVGEPLSVESWEVLDAAQAQSEPRRVSAAERLERRRVALASLRASIEGAGDAADIVRRARLFFLDLNVESVSELLATRYQPDDVKCRSKAVDALAATLLARLQRRYERDPGADLGSCPPPAILAPVDELVAGLLRRHFPGPRQGVSAQEVETAFDLFAAGRLGNHPHPAGALSNGVPNGAMFFAFAELADVGCDQSSCNGGLWAELLPCFATSQRVFLAAHRPRRKSFSRYSPKDCVPLRDPEISHARGRLERDLASARASLWRQAAAAFADGWYS